MKTTHRALAVLLLTLSGCSSAETGAAGGGSTTSGTGTTTGTGTATGTETGTVTGVRGDRYCEVLVGDVVGTKVRIDVYNTYGLNDCPAEQWDAIDADQIEAEQGADVVILNGPRLWRMDAFVSTSVVDPTVVQLGGIDMRVAGTLELSLADAKGGGSPYVPRTVARTTTWVYEAGKPVFELVDPEGRVYDMQSCNVAEIDQTEATLAALGDELTPPGGWQYRTRVLDADLQVTAVDGLATVVQDDVGNTYQLSQQ